MIEGTGRMRIDDDDPLTLAPLSTVLVEPDTVRQVFNDTAEDALWLVVGTPPELANTLEMSAELLAFDVSRRPARAAAGAHRRLSARKPGHARAGTLDDGVAEADRDDHDDHGDGDNCEQCKSDVRDVHDKPPGWFRHSSSRDRLLAPRSEGGAPRTPTPGRPVKDVVVDELTNSPAPAPAPTMNHR